jgi:L-seryl-tRNA(Ser) seleniumtransferase
MPLVTMIARDAIEAARAEIEADGTADVDAIAQDLARARERSAGLSVVNATGVLLHTNLGRALWSAEAAARAVETATRFTNLELDIETGERGRRGGYVETLLTKLTGAGSALVVNNNAAALLLALTATASGKSVPVARGELIEIGGSYRLPDVMNASSARLVEIGTTNRTRVGDYVTAIQTHQCGALLKIHPSNYRVEGFHEEAGLDELARIATSDLPLIFDLGSGLLDSEAPWIPRWLRGEPAVRQSLGAGADLVLFSGDKLLGGPQAGVVVGDSSLVADLRAHPLARALRVDGVTYAAMAATLEAYMDDMPSAIPFWSHALAEESALERRSLHIADLVEGVVERGASVVGAGAAPGVSIPGPIIRLESRDDLFEPLLGRDVPVLTRRESGDLLIDLRAVAPGEDDLVAQSVSECL